MKFIKPLFLVLLLLLLWSSANAQPGFPTNPDQAPIDGGLSLLAAAGGVYAFKKLKEKTMEDQS